MATDPQALAAALGATPPAGQFSPVPTPQAAPTGTPAAAPVNVPIPQVQAKPGTAMPPIDPVQAALMNQKIADLQASRERAAAASAQRPELEKQAKEKQDEIAKINADAMASQKEYIDDLKALAQERKNLIEPSYKNNFQQTTPWVMMLMALGGKAAKLHGTAMMAGQVGMLNGMQQYNMNMYNEGLNKYKAAVDALNDRGKIAREIRDASLEWYKNQVDAPLLALKNIQTALGDDEKIIGAPAQQLDSMIASYDNIRKNAMEIEKLDEQHRHNSATEKLARDKLQAGAKGADSKFQSSLFTSRVNAVENSWNALEAKINANPDLRRDIDAGALTGNDLIQRLNRVASPEVAAFEKSVGQAIGQYIRVINSGMSAGAIRAGGVKLTEAEMKGFPDLKQGYFMAKAGVEGLINLKKEVDKAAGVMFKESENISKDTSIEDLLKKYAD